MALAELAGLHAAGVSHFRLSPQAGMDMVQVAAEVRAVADGARTAQEAAAALRAMAGPVPFINGYLHGRAGMAWVPAA